MKFSFLIFTLTTCLLGTLAPLSCVAFQAEPAKSELNEKPVQQSVDKNENTSTSDGRVRFSFQDQEWSEVIPWFAEQAGFSMQNVEKWPSGTFSLKDNESYSTIEALDQLNRSLASLSDPYTLIRNRKMLMLKPYGEPIPDDLIETVQVEDLDDRGSFELMNVIFDLGDLDSQTISQDVISQITDRNKDHFAILQTANQVQVRETGQRLRNIRSIIEVAKKRLDDSTRNLITYQLKYQDAESFIEIVGSLLGIPEGKNSNPEGTISIKAIPLSNRLFVSGSNKMLAKFRDFAAQVDNDPNENQEELVLDKPYLHPYPVLGDPELAFQLLQTMLEGSDVRMQQDQESGAIIVLGRELDHQLVQNSLDTISKAKTKNFAIVKLEKISAQEALAILQSIYRQDSLSLEASSGPVLLADSYLNQIMISGSVQEVANTEMILSELDAKHVPLATGPRTSVRIIPMNSDDQRRLAPMIPDLLGKVGRPNLFNIIRPESRKDFGDRIERGETAVPSAREQPLDFDEPKSNIPAPRAPGTSTNKIDRVRQTSLIDNDLSNYLLALFSSKFSLTSLGSVAMLPQVASSDEAGLSYQAPTQRSSVPGAPIEFRFTEFGLTIESDDLDAIDDIESEIQNFVGQDSEIQLPSFFELRHRRVTEIKTMLEDFFGMGDAGGGGDGGLMGGMMNNMLGGGGDLLGGILGDTGGTSSSESTLEGDVTFGVDVRFNTLWVRGATGNDLAFINRLLENWDRPEGDTTPEVMGDTRTIQVLHRDVSEVVEIVKAQMPEFIYNEQSGEAKQGNNDVAKLMQAAQMLNGGKKSGGSSSISSGMKPTAVLGSDSKNNLMLVTGPEFIYKKILNLVKSVDVPQAARTTVVIPGISSSALVLQAIKQKYQDQIQMSADDPAESASGAKSSANSAATKNNRSASDRARQQVQRNIQQALGNSIRQQSQGGGGGGGRNGGAGGRGGRGGR